MTTNITPDVLRFLQLADQVASIAADPSLDWQGKYDRIFGTLSVDIAVTGVFLEWADPDMSYEEDVRAYADAVARAAKEERYARQQRQPREEKAAVQIIHQVFMDGAKASAPKQTLCGLSITDPSGAGAGAWTFHDNITTCEACTRRRKDLETPVRLTEAQVDVLLQLTPEHERTSCSDDGNINGFGSNGAHLAPRCTRCALLEVKQHGAEEIPLGTKVQISFVAK